VHDTVDLESRGVPTAFVATTEFRDGAEAQARALGADPLGVYVPHPIQDRSDEEMREIAEAAFDAVRGALAES